MKQILTEFIPIIFIFLLLTYTEKMAEFGNTGLGKLIIIIIILFYTSIDKLYGVLVCLLFIFFYQTETVENMLNKHDIKNTEGFEPIQDIPIKHNTIKPLESTCYSKQYELPKINTDIVKNEFRQKHCEKGHLVNKGQKVRIDMAEHVYPEVSFDNDKCNICDSKCDFNIIENKLNISQRLAPKSGR